MGDLNLDLLNSDSLTKHYLDVVQYFGLKPYVEVPTRFGLNRNSCLDHVMCRQKDNNSVLEITDCSTKSVSFSDPMAISFLIQNKARNNCNQDLNRNTVRNKKTITVQNPEFVILNVKIPNVKILNVKIPNVKILNFKILKVKIPKPIS